MNKEEELKAEFEKFIEKVLGEWEENAQKAKEFGDHDVVKTEYVKCNIAKVIRTVYNVKYKEIYGGQ